MNSILFLSQSPHEAHLGFARVINAKIKIIPFKGLASVAKNHSVLGGGLFAILSFMLSFYTRTKSDILLVDGGLPIPTALALKKKYKNIKIIYLDADLFLYSLHKHNRTSWKKWNTLLQAIDGIITVSEENKKYIPSFLNVPIKICPPFSKAVYLTNVMRKNYGLYVGRLDPDKNIKRIIQFGLQCPHFEKFIVIGEGAQRNYVKKMARIHKKIVYLGKRKDVEKYYSMCKFLIHLPDHDPHPTTTMESAICGCFPIISKNIGTNYLFDKIFIVNNSENFYEINDKIKYILENENKAKKLLKKNIHLIPNKKDSLKKFKKAFLEIVKDTNKK